MKSIIGILTFFLAVAHAAAQTAPPLAIVTLGNSITSHAPKASIGWSGNWGMGASTQSKDYSAQLGDLLSLSTRRKTTVERFNVSNFEKHPDTSPPPAVISAALAAEIVVVELGDNLQSTAMEIFQRQYTNLLHQIHSPSNILLCTSTYWPRAALSSAIKAACQGAGGIFVDIGGINADTANNASYLTDATNDVRNHPGDQGMRKIAEAIHAQILQSSKYSRLLSRK